ncbi:glycosyltransferase [Collinsella tanakaei]|nr:glycosyltransferase [Collinsella tanakaei]
MGAPIRVAHVMGKMVGGGVEQVVMNYYRHIDRSRVQFDFIVDSDSTLVPQTEIESLGGRVFTVPPYQHPIAYQKALIPLFREQEWAIVHSHENTLSVFPLRAAKRAGVPVRIAHSHATAGEGEFVRNVMKYALRPLANLNPTHRLACSDHAGKWLFGNEHFDVLVNAFDVDGFGFRDSARTLFRQAHGIDEAAVVFGHAGRFAPPKNQARLIHIFARVAAKRPESIMVLAGQGPDLAPCRKLAKELGVGDRIVFPGQCRDMAAFYSAIDMFLLPSTYEGLGLALVEAQAAGLPCLASSSVCQEANPTHEVAFASYDDESAWEAAMLNMEPRQDRALTAGEGQSLKPFEIAGAASWLASYYEKAAQKLAQKDAAPSERRRK